MSWRIVWGGGVGAAILVLLLCITPTEALGLRGLGVKVGVDLTQEQNIVLGGTQFNSASLFLGAHLDLGSIFIPRLHFVPGMDMVLKDKFKTFSLNGDSRYLFGQGGKTVGYVGAGFGVHFHRFDSVLLLADASLSNNSKISVNIPIGFQRKVSRGLLWFGELKLVVADDQVDSSFRFSVGVTLGAAQ